MTMSDGTSSVPGDVHDAAYMIDSTLALQRTSRQGLHTRHALLREAVCCRRHSSAHSLLCVGGFDRTHETKSLTSSPHLVRALKRRPLTLAKTHSAPTPYPGFDHLSCLTLMLTHVAGHVLLAEQGVTHPGADSSRWNACRVPNHSMSATQPCR